MPIFGKKPKTKKAAKQDSAQDAAEKFYTLHFSEERMKVRHLVQNGWFSSFIYGVIFINTILIAFDDINAERDNTSWVVVVSAYSDWIILGIFTIEMTLKMIGLGIGFKPPVEEEVDPEVAGYFAGPWNRLDSFIVLMSWVLVPVAAFSGANVQKLVRVLRLARPLRALREIKNLRSINELVQTVPLALASFIDVTFFLIFVLLVFSILALNIWGLEGKFHGRCVVDTSEMSIALQTRGLLQVPRTLCGAGGHMCGPGFICSCAPAVNQDGSIERQPYAYTNPVSGNPGCLVQGTARPWVEGLQSDEPVCPEAGYTCFNTFFLAMFTNFKAITLESWSQIMWYAQDIGSPFIGWFFFVLMISVVSFNIMNLYVASMSSAYTTVQQKNKDQDRMDKIELQLKEQKKRERAEKKQRKLAGEQIAQEKEDDEEISSSESEEEEEEEDDDDERDAFGVIIPKKKSYSDIIFDPNTYWMEHQNHIKPLNSLALAIRRVTSYPQEVRNELYIP